MTRFERVTKIATTILAISVLGAVSLTAAGAANVPPAPTITSGPGHLTTSTSFTFSYTESLRGVRFRCSIDESAYRSCPASGATYDDLPPGSHTFSVESQSGSGPWSAPASYPCRIDRTPPTITVTFPANLGFYNASSWTGTITGTAEDPASAVRSVSLAVQRDANGRYWNGSSFSASSPDFLTATGASSWDLRLPLPPDGAYTLDVRASDDLGNSSDADGLRVFFSVATATPPAPIITFEPTNPSTNTSPAFQFTDARRPVNFYCQLDRRATIDCTGDTRHAHDPGFEGKWRYSNLEIGRHCFNLYVVDKSGDKSPTTSYCWTVIGRLLPFSIGGDISPLFYPGESQLLDLVFTNPNPTAITILSGAITISISTTRARCPVSANFVVSRGMTTTVTVPAHSTRSLGQLSVGQAHWPLITMIETHTNQDACEGAPLTFTYAGSATG